MQYHKKSETLARKSRDRELGCFWFCVNNKRTLEKDYRGRGEAAGLDGTRMKQSEENGVDHIHSHSYCVCVCVCVLFFILFCTFSRRRPLQSAKVSLFPENSKETQIFNRI